MAQLDVAGRRNGHAILFLHGASWNRMMWLPQTKALAGEFRTIALDLPGHGSEAARTFTFKDAVNDAIAAIEQEADGQALLVGSSLGGYVAIEVAARRPDLVTGLVLSGCCADYRGLLGLRALFNGLMLRLVSGKPVRQRMQRALEGMPIGSSARHSIAQAGFTPKSWGRAFWALVGKNFRGRLNTYPGQALILNGEDDGLNRKGEAAMLAAAKHGRLQIIEAAGHLCSLQQPQVFTAAVRDFARSLQWP